MVRKALKICADGNTCRECPYCDYSAKCLSQLLQAALDVVNNISDESIRGFAHYLIDSAHDGVIKVSDMPELVIKYSEVGHE